MQKCQRDGEQRLRDSYDDNKRVGRPVMRKLPNYDHKYTYVRCTPPLKEKCILWLPGFFAIDDQATWNSLSDPVNNPNFTGQIFQPTGSERLSPQCEFYKGYFQASAKTAVLAKQVLTNDAPYERTYSAYIDTASIKSRCSVFGTKSRQSFLSSSMLCSMRVRSAGLSTPTRTRSSSAMS